MGLSKDKKALILIILFSILIRIPYLNCPIQPDEGAYAYQAYFWLKGINFYRSRFCNTPPGLPLIYALIFETIGTRVDTLRLFLSIWNAISVLFVYLITLRLLDEKKALASAFIFAYLSWLPTLQGIMQKEVYMLLPYLISLYLYLLYQGKNRIYLLFSGIFLAMTITIRQTATPLLFHFLLFIYIQSKRKGRDSLILLIGVFSPLILVMLYGYTTLDGMNFLYQVAEYRLTTASIFVGPWWWHLLRFLYSISVTGIVFLIFAALLGWSYLDREKNFNKLFIISFFLFSLFGGVMGGRWFFHYYLQITPALSIWLGWCTFCILKQKRGIKIIFFIFLSIPFIFYIFAICYTGDFYLSHEKNYDITLQLSRYIQTHCKQNQEIYAFLYSNPGLYFLAKRKSAIPYLFRSEILFNPNILWEVKEAIKHKKIRYLVTYSLPYSLKIAKMHCGYDTHNFINLIKACFSPNFVPFCKDYPIQLSLIRQVFKTIPKYYLPVKSIPFDNTHVIIWKKKASEN
ncbi:MAG: hypothetical protein DRP81_07445 [Candidatus Omnitrophota bacterium]|nr:MAG: hypothetical protein DRP81_07445 [Candidatus Omnitrophota bacterium]